MQTILEYIRKSKTTDYISTDILDNPDELIEYLKNHGFLSLPSGHGIKYDTGMISATHNQKCFRTGSYKKPSEEWISAGDGNNRILFIHTRGGIYDGIRFRYETYDVQKIGNATVSNINKIKFLDAGECIEVLQELAES